MEGSKSFSIDALLGRDRPTTTTTSASLKRSLEVPSPPSPHHHHPHHHHHPAHHLPGLHKLPPGPLRLSPPASPASSSHRPGSLSPASLDDSLSPTGRSVDSPVGHRNGSSGERGGSLPGSPPGHLPVNSIGAPSSVSPPVLTARPGGAPPLLPGSGLGGPGSLVSHAGGMLHGLFPGGHPVYTYNGHALGQVGYPVPMLNGSAFHLPPDHALKAAQLAGVHADWFARAGMLVPRPLDYTGKIIHEIYLFNLVEIVPIFKPM